MYRLNIDLPLGEDEHLAIDIAHQIIQRLRDVDAIQSSLRVTKDAMKGDPVFQYKVSNDTDRRANNYLVKDENGHVSGKKLVEELNEDH